MQRSVSRKSRRLVAMVSPRSMKSSRPCGADMSPPASRTSNTPAARSDCACARNGLLTQGIAEVLFGIRFTQTRAKP